MRQWISCVPSLASSATTVDFSRSLIFAFLASRIFLNLTRSCSSCSFFSSVRVSSCVLKYAIVLSFSSAPDRCFLASS